MRKVVIEQIPFVRFGALYSAGKLSGGQIPIAPPQRGMAARAPNKANMGPIFLRGHFIPADPHL